MRKKCDFERAIENSDRLAIEPRTKQRNEATRNLPWFYNVENW